MRILTIVLRDIIKEQSEQKTTYPSQILCSVKSPKLSDSNHSIK